jgi:hypothetical protein
VDVVRGQRSGLLIPARGEALRTAGATFLTEAFHRFGSLPSDNRVERITRCERCSGGSTGQKLLLSVEYRYPHPGLHTDLFVKFSRDFQDPVRDARGKYEMESEIRLAAISRLPAFPIPVPAAYFADYEGESKTGLLISQCIAFGVGGIEPHRAKCLDHELSDPLSYYRVIIRALAQVAAAHKSGRLSPEVELQFPYDAEIAARANPIPYDALQLHELVSQYANFAARCPQLLPAPIATREFIERFDRELARFLEHEVAIRRFLQSAPDLIALCHWNAQIDNAWFWRTPSGDLRCGLMDWGHVGQMNVAFSLWGCLSGAPQALWDRHLGELLALFVDELQQHGGPRIAVPELKLHLQLYIAMMGLSYFVASPARILSALPEAATAAGPLDPVFRQNERARNNLHILSVFLMLWLTQDLGAVLDRLLRRLKRVWHRKGYRY